MTLTDANPVLGLIEAGHFLKEGKCRECGTEYPCAPMKKAREDASYRARALDMAKWEQTRREARRSG